MLSGGYSSGEEVDDSYSDPDYLIPGDHYLSDEDEELDYVHTTVHNSSQDSMDDDAPLSSYAAAHAAPAPAPAADWTRNKPGTSGFVWRDVENVPRRNGFAGSPGVEDPDLSGDSTPLDCFRAFLTEEIWGHIVTETNR